MSTKKRKENNKTMEKTTVTKREMFGAIKTAAENGATFGENITAEMVKVFCDKEIATLDARADKAKERAAQKKAQADEMTEAVYAALSTEDFQTLAAVVKATDGDDVTAGKVQYRLKVLVDTNRAVRGEIVLTSEDGKKRTVTGYKAI